MRIASTQLETRCFVGGKGKDSLHNTFLKAARMQVKASPSDMPDSIVPLCASSGERNSGPFLAPTIYMSILGNLVSNLDNFNPPPIYKMVLCFDTSSTRKRCVLPLQIHSRDKFLIPPSLWMSICVPFEDVLDNFCQIHHVRSAI
jgi:hypothetical protein